MARRAKPSGKPTTRVRETLARLGYAEHEDFEYEVEVRLYGNRRLYADVMLFQGDTPLVVVEVEGNTQHLQAGYDEARLKGAAWNLENPVPLLWVAAGNHDALYQLQPSQSSIRYAPLEGVSPCGTARSCTLVGSDWRLPAPYRNRGGAGVALSGHAPARAC
jgi:hypothetical protein